MKKIFLFLLCSVLFVGCTSQKYSSQVSDSDTTLVSGENISISKQDFYSYLMDNSGASEILKTVLSSIADKEITDQKQIDSLLAEKKKTYASYYNNSLLKYAQAIGFKTEEEFIEKQLLPEVKEELLREKYIEKNYDQLLKDYQVASLKKITVDKESTALEIIKASTSQEKFEEQMKNYKDNSEDCKIVTKNNETLDENIVKKMETFHNQTKDGVYKEAIKLSSDKYAVIYVYDCQRKNKDDYIKALASDSDIQNTIESYYLKQYHFEVYDEKVKKAIKEISDDFIE